MAKIFIKLLKTNIEKMSTFGLSMMLMKTNELHASIQDVDENKGPLWDSFHPPWEVHEIKWFICKHSDVDENTPDVG